MHHLGLIGLGTMGANLARNAARTGATIAVFNRTPEKTDAFVRAFGSEGAFLPCRTYAELAAALPAPRSILLMVKAGPDTDSVIEDLLPHLEAGDCIIDAGNSHYMDTDRREKLLVEEGIAFIGMGVSGGEEGALKGPSMMPGGDRETVERLIPLLSAMAADDQDGGKCVAYMGPGGAGHFVKMVHNGIEYGVMQLIAEAYHLLSHTRPERNADDLAVIFSTWNAGDDLHSYLMEITADILRKRDDETGGLLLDMIEDTARQKGTGRWTTEAALLLGVAVPTITAAVDARILSARKQDRVHAASLLGNLSVDTPTIATEDVRKALRCSIVTAYAQGFSMLTAASREYGWNLDLSEIARIWQGGCIIRASLLQEVRRAYQQSVPSDSLLLHSPLLDVMKHAYDAWTNVVANGIRAGVPLPAMSASLAYDGQMFWERLPSNLIAAQRDYFGAHGFERTDKEGVWHGEWLNE
jgi:6-phosphogluconate dehydrogenase